MNLSSRFLLFLTVIALGCGPRAPTTAEVDPALARLIPSNALALVDVKADALRGSPLYKKYAADRLSSLKVTEDVAEALAVSNGKDVSVFTKGKSGVWQYDSQGNRTAPPSRSGGVPPPLRDLLRGIPAQNQIFGAGLGSALPSPDALPQQGNLANLSNVLKALQSWTVSADLRSRVKLEVNAVYQTDADAKRINDALRGILGIARLSTPSDSPELLRVFDGIRITVDKAAVRVSTDIDPDLLDKAVSRAKSQSSGLPWMPAPTR